MRNGDALSLPARVQGCVVGARMPKRVLCRLCPCVCVGVGMCAEEMGGRCAAPIDHACRLGYELRSAVAWVHSKNIMHRDIKPQNILLQEAPHGAPPVLKLADFGSAWYTHKPLAVGSEVHKGERGAEYTHKPLAVGSKVHEGELGAHTADLGTLWYRSPEVLLSHTFYSCALDMWSVGCVLAEFELKRPAFGRQSCEVGLLFQIFKVLGTPRDGAFPDMKRWSDFSASKFPRWPTREASDGLPLAAACGKCFTHSICDVLRVDPHKQLRAATLEAQLRPEYTLGRQT